MTDFWTADRIETLRTKKAEGLSATEIAYRLGDNCTRNMVIGKLHRLGISQPEKADDWTAEQLATLKRMHVEGADYADIAVACGRSASSCRQKASRIGLGSRGHNTFRRSAKPASGDRKPAWNFKRKVIDGMEEPSTDGAVDLLAMTGCKWPVSPDDCAKDEHRFCNHPKEELKSYCPYHEAMKRAAPVPKAEVKRFKVPTSLLRAVA